MPGFRKNSWPSFSASKARSEMFRNKIDGPKTAEDREKLILKARSLYREPLFDWYTRPFTFREAQDVLASAGIEFEQVTGTALSGRSDPTGESQVIEAVVAGREVHFHLQYSGKWKVTKVFVASSLTGSG